MNDPVTPQLACRRCKTAIDASDNYCRQCGTPTAVGETALAAWWEGPWVVLPLLFVVLGPLALPLLWRSRRFTRPWKIALSVIVVAVTLYAVWQVWYTLNQLLEPLLQLEKLH
jgi:RNA polymerase subunit RPABC4/transcription elongation factor Spt4